MAEQETVSNNSSPLIEYRTQLKLAARSLGLSGPTAWTLSLNSVAQQKAAVSWPEPGTARSHPHACYHTLWQHCLKNTYTSCTCSSYCPGQQSAVQTPRHRAQALAYPLPAIAAKGFRVRHGSTTCL